MAAWEMVIYAIFALAIILFAAYEFLLVRCYPKQERLLKQQKPHYVRVPPYFSFGRSWVPLGSGFCRLTIKIGPLD